jgi:hypothetical protein
MSVVCQREGDTIAGRGTEHDSGESGTSLEAPVSCASKWWGFDTDVFCLFEHRLLVHVAALVARQIGMRPEVALGMLYNFAEAVGCGLLRSHIDDQQAGALGTNCTAGGQTWGTPASQKIATHINHIRAVYSPEDAERAVNEPAVVHVKHDAGLMVGPLGAPRPGGT